MFGPLDLPQRRIIDALALTSPSHVEVLLAVSAQKGDAETCTYITVKHLDKLNPEFQEKIKELGLDKVSAAAWPMYEAMYKMEDNPELLTPESILAFIDTIQSTKAARSAAIKQAIADTEPKAPAVPGTDTVH